MAGVFVRAAFRVLSNEGKPLDSVQIVEIAQQRGYLRSRGKTPANTMRARLSDDIRTLGVSSLFLRTGPNRFGLREWDFTEYHAPTFQRSVPDEVTVCVPGTIKETLGLPGIWYQPIDDRLLRYLADSRNLFFVNRRTAESTSQIKQLIAYVWLETEDGLVLVYTRGKYSSAHPTLLLGRRSVGFGGHVLRQDAEGLFGRSDAGLEQAAVREIAEEVGIEPTAVEIAGVIWDDSSFEGQRHVGVVMRGQLPRSDALSARRGERAIAQLHLLSRRQLWEQYHAMEFWSQLLIRQFASNCRPANISSIVPPNRPSTVRHLVLVGEIANGKSWIAGELAKKLGYSVVSASSVLRRMLGVNMQDERDRQSFQAIALNFIRSETGPARLAKELSFEVARIGASPAIVDGIRQIATLDALRPLVQSMVVIYIDAPRDMAFARYQTRLAGASVLDFASVREHEVEADLPKFRFEADAVINNADTKENTLDVLIDWLTR